VAQVSDRLRRVGRRDRVRDDERRRPVAGVEQAELELGPVALGRSAVGSVHARAPAASLSRLEIRTIPRDEVRLVGLDTTRSPHLVTGAGIDHFDLVGALAPAGDVGLRPPRQARPARPYTERVVAAAALDPQRDHAQRRIHATPITRR
jgi:hypothetical protein